MLNKATFQGIYNILADAFEAPQKDLELWIEKNMKHFLELDRWYVDADPDTVIFDTADREQVYDTIGLFFLKRTWPTYGDGASAYETFKVDLARAVERYGWNSKL